MLRLRVKVALHMIKGFTLWNVESVKVSAKAGYTRRHLFQRTDEHKHSAIGKHLRDAQNQNNQDLYKQFTILKKCRGKFECLIYEMLFIQEMKPKLNTQTDSIKASNKFIGIPMYRWYYLK